MNSKRISKRKASLQLASAWLLALVGLRILAGTYVVEAHGPHVWISSLLEEWELIGTERAPVLGLHLHNERPDFRVGIEMFREGMGRAIPSGLAPGARVSVLVQEKQYAHPLTPRVGPSAEIVWVRGLRVNDKEIFGLATAREWEESNRLWGLAAFLASMSFLGYSHVRWRRAR